MPDMVFSNAIFGSKVLKEGSWTKYSRLKAHIERGLFDIPVCENYAIVPLFFLSFLLFIARPPVLSTMLNCIIMPHDYYDNMWHVLMVKIPCIGYNS